MKIIVGIDEVGRGAWAGPLVVGAVVLDKKIFGLTDSKLINKKSREKLAKKIKLEATAVSLGWVASDEIDEIGLTAATTLACKRAIEQIKLDYDEIVIDGSINYLPDNPKASCIVKADSTVPAVSAASIIAKVTRDEHMAELASKHTGYGFENHVGYGTKLHVQALKDLGVCPIHRKSYKPIKANGTA